MMVRESWISCYSAFIYIDNVLGQYELQPLLPRDMKKNKEGEIASCMSAFIYIDNVMCQDGIQQSLSEDMKKKEGEGAS